LATKDNPKAESFIGTEFQVLTYDESQLRFPDGTDAFNFPIVDTTETLKQHLGMQLTDIIVPGKEGTGANGAGMLTLNLNARNAIIRFRNAFAGDPYYASGRWMRMLYLAIQTQTTLGSGDIVPVTTRARLLVGSEALTGLILMGLFLNALAIQIGKNPRRSGEVPNGSER
jgi:hypothetical protein